jgi:hypothetical protein
MNDVPPFLPTATAHPKAAALDVSPGLATAEVALAWLSPVAREQIGWWLALGNAPRLAFEGCLPLPAPPLAEAKPTASPQLPHTLLPAALSITAPTRQATAQTIASLGKAFYCGSLPNVLLVHLWPGDEAPLVQALVKLMTMQASTGYWLQAQRLGLTLQQQAQRSLPAIVLLGDAMMYSSVYHRLAWQLQQVEDRQFGTTNKDALLEAVTGQVVRCLVPNWLPQRSPGQAPLTLLATQTHVGRQVQSVFNTLCWPSRMRDVPRQNVVIAEWQAFTLQLRQCYGLHSAVVAPWLGLLQGLAVHQSWPLAMDEPSEVTDAPLSPAHQRTLTILADYACKQGLWQPATP